MAEQPMLVVWGVPLYGPGRCRVCGRNAGPRFEGGRCGPCAVSGALYAHSRRCPTCGAVEGTPCVARMHPEAASGT